MSISKTMLKSVMPSDFLTIARLESEAFRDDEFSAVAFGPNRFSDAALAARVADLEKEPKGPGETARKVKAVITFPDGNEEIVGFADWRVCIGRGGSQEEKSKLGAKEDCAGERYEEKEKDPFGLGAHVRLCEDTFLKGDEHMARATEGRDYAKLCIIVVSPKYQRQGIGTTLLEDGLREADVASLQVVLGASPHGIGLYRRYGFVDFEVKDLKLWEYEGGEGMGIERHVIMHRPAKTGTRENRK